MAAGHAMQLWEYKPTLDTFVLYTKNTCGQIPTDSFDLIRSEHYKAVVGGH